MTRQKAVEAGSERVKQNNLHSVLLRPNISLVHQKISR